MSKDNTPTNDAICVKSLDKFYGSFHALRCVDLSVCRGEIFGFLGPNGAGKTTLVRCLLDLIRPNGGQLQVLGLCPQKQSLEVRKRCGYLPGELRLDENLTTKQAIQFFSALRGNSKSIRQKADEIADRLQLKLSQRIRNLSKGNKQKIGIVAAFMHKPELLLLDEPTSGLDPLVQQTVLDLVREAQAGGATVFFSSHVLAEVQAIADRVAIVRDGSIVQVGRTADLTHADERILEVIFETEIPPEQVAALPGINHLQVSADARSANFVLTGNFDGFLKALSKYPVKSLVTRPPSLEEVFLTHYQNKPKG